MIFKISLTIFTFTTFLFANAASSVESAIETEKEVKNYFDNTDKVRDEIIIINKQEILKMYNNVFEQTNINQIRKLEK